ncbi:MAG: LysR substrate-binding domain-containing protein [Nannocystaceae bacterium]
MSSELFAGIAPFVAVAEERSFRRAAESLGVSTAAVSKAIRRLEESLGVRLFDRTSRSVALSPEGQALLGRAREALALLRAGREAASDAAREPRGSVRVSLPFVLVRALTPALARLGPQHPELAVHLHFSDQLTRLVDDQIDVAIRMGELADSSLVGRLLFRPRWVTLGAPAYLGRRGVPRRPDDLAHHELLAFVMPNGQRRPWELRRASGRGEPRVIAPAGAIDSNFGDALVEAAVAGVGLLHVLDFMAADAIARGDLLEVLGDHALPGPPIHALCLAERQNTPRVRAVLDALIAATRGRPGK